MAETRENERVVRRALDAINDRDAAVLQECFHPKVVWREANRTSPLGGPFEGVGAILSFLAARFESTGDTLAVDVHDVVASDEHVVALIRVTGKRGSRKLEDESVFVVHVEDGLIREIWSYNQDDVSANEFWG